MKKKLFTIILLGILAYSCSSDDDNNVVNLNEKKLIRIESTEYFGNNNVGESIKRYFEDGKLKVDSTWNNNGNFRSKRNYIYNADGLISEENFEVIQTGLTAEWDYTYDNQGRLINYDYREVEPGFGTFERNIEYNYVSNTLVEATNLANGDTTNLNFSTDGLLLSAVQNQSVNEQYTYMVNQDIETITYPSNDEVVTVNYTQTNVLGGFSRLNSFHNGNTKNFLITVGEIPYAGESFFGARKLISSRVHIRNGFTSSINYQHLLDADGYLIEEIQTSLDYNDDYYSSEYFYE
jgi:hypothetical protein